MEALVNVLVQFGPAGLIGFLWLYERRNSVNRERQLDEAHRTTRSLDRQVDSLLTVVKDNTRVVNSLEQSQRHLIGLLEQRFFSSKAQEA